MYQEYRRSSHPRRAALTTTSCTVPAFPAGPRISREISSEETIRHCAGSSSSAISAAVTDASSGGWPPPWCGPSAA